MTRLEREVPAKINLMLAVDRPRADGMHPIASWMCTVGLCDHIEIEHRPESLTSLYAIEWHEEAAKRSEIDWAIGEDLGVRAHLALEEEVGKKLPVRMRVRKRIPVGAGLGGGSSDAAGVLVMTREVFCLDVSDARLEEIAHGLGSDVPFFVRMMNEGARAAFVRGLGEDIEVVPDPVVEGSDEMHVLLMVPGCECKTSAAYHQFDETWNENHTFLDIEVARAARAGLIQFHELFNDLEGMAVSSYADMSDVVDDLEATLDPTFRMTGSGSTFFSVFQTHDDAIEASNKIRDLHRVVMRIIA